MLRAIVGQFEVPCSSVHEGFVYEADANQAFKRAVDCDFVEMFLARSPGDLLLAERLAYLGQDFKDG